MGCWLVDAAASQADTETEQQPLDPAAVRWDPLGLESQERVL